MSFVNIVDDVVTLAKTAVEEEEKLLGVDSTITPITDTLGRRL